MTSPAHLLPPSYTLHFLVKCYAIGLSIMSMYFLVFVASPWLLTPNQLVNQLPSALEKSFPDQQLSMDNMTTFLPQVVGGLGPLYPLPAQYLLQSLWYNNPSRSSSSSSSFSSTSSSSVFRRRDYQAIFQALDQNKDGLLTREELLAQGSDGSLLLGALLEARRSAEAADPFDLAS